MRSTSIKSVLAAVSIATTLTLAVPAVAANRSSRDTRMNRGEGVIRVVVKALRRIADFTTNILPSTPPGTPEGTTTTTSGTGTGG